MQTAIGNSSPQELWQILACTRPKHERLAKQLRATPKAEEVPSTLHMLEIYINSYLHVIAFHWSGEWSRSTGTQTLLTRLYIFFPCFGTIRAMMNSPHPCESGYSIRGLCQVQLLMPHVLDVWMYLLWRQVMAAVSKTDETELLGSQPWATTCSRFYVPTAMVAMR